MHWEMFATQRFSVHRDNILCMQNVCHLPIRLYFQNYEMRDAVFTGKPLLPQLNITSYR